MFIEGTYSWDTEGEATSLEWPPFMSPGIAAESTRVQPAEEVELGTDPSLTPGQGHAQAIDSLVTTGIFAEDPPPRALQVHEDPGNSARYLGTARQDELDEDEDEGDEWDPPPRRRLSASKGTLIVFAMVATVALSGGYAAQAFGWRLPPKLRESARPMRAFLRNLTLSRLASLMPAQVGRLRLRAPDQDGRTFPTPELVPPMQPATGSLAGSMPVPSQTQVSTVGVPSSQVVDPADTRTWLDPESLAPSPTLAAGASGTSGQPIERESTEAVSALPSLPASAAVSESAGAAASLRVATRAWPVLSNRDHLPRPWHGLVWSPAAQALVPAVPAPQDQATATLLRAPSAAVPVR